MNAILENCNYLEVAGIGAGIGIFWGLVIIASLMMIGVV